MNDFKKGTAFFVQDAQREIFMNYQSLLYFKTVAELQHYTKAANKLYITQPTLSKVIRNLEIELGCNLFQKDGRNVILTRYGTAFYDYVSRALNEIDDGIATVRHMVDMEKNIIFISALFSLYSKFLPDQILQFRHRFPNSRFSIQHKFTTAILNDVLEKRSELGLCSNFEPVGKYAPLVNFHLYDEPLTIIVSKSHPFAQRDDKIKIPELKGEPFIVYIWTSLGTNKILTDLCAPYGFEPNISLEAYSDHGVMGAVAAGDGIAIMPKADCLNIPSLVCVDVDTGGLPFVRTMNLVWRADDPLPPLALSFRDMLISEANSNPE